jgi:hypothetical protein
MTEIIDKKSEIIEAKVVLSGFAKTVWLCHMVLGFMLLNPIFTVANHSTGAE